MTERESLLAAVIADPDDDAIRLVYADWLEENGDDAEVARAEFIRVQIEKESVPEGEPKRAALETRAKELLALHADAWMREWPERARPTKGSLVADEAHWCGFRRGFLQGRVLGEASDFLAEAPALFAIEPVTRLILVRGSALKYLSHSREFLGISVLRCQPYAVGDQSAAVFSKFPIMPRLRRLHMSENYIGNPGMKALTGWPGLNTVEELDLSFNDFTLPGVKALIDSPYLTNLKRLQLDDKRLRLTRKTRDALRERFGETLRF